MIITVSTTQFFSQKRNLFNLFKKAAEQKKITYGGEVTNNSAEIFTSILKVANVEFLCKPPSGARFLGDCGTVRSTVVSKEYISTKTSTRVGTRNRPGADVYQGSLHSDKTDILLVGYSTRGVVGFATLHVNKDYVKIDLLCATPEGKGHAFLEVAEQLANLLNIPKLTLDALNYMIGSKDDCDSLVRDPSNPKKIKTLVGYYQKHGFQAATTLSSHGAPPETVKMEKVLQMNHRAFGEIEIEAYKATDTTIDLTIKVDGYELVYYLKVSSLPSIDRYKPDRSQLDMDIWNVGRVNEKKVLGAVEAYVNANYPRLRDMERQAWLLKAAKVQGV